MYQYQKYILRSIAPTFVTFSVVLTSLVWITQTLRLIHLLDKGIALKTFFKIIILLIPSLLFMILPVISVIAIIIAYHQLQKDNQLIILQSIGLSNFCISKPALYISTIITIFSIFISAYFMPYSYRKLKLETRNVHKVYLSHHVISIKTFNHISNTSTIYVNHKHSDGSVDGIVFFDNKMPEHRIIFFAKRGKIINIYPYNSTKFELTEGMRHAYDKNGKITKLYFDTLSIIIPNNNSHEQSGNKTSLELYLNEMIWPDQSLSINKQNRLIIDGHSRIIWPLYNLTFVMLALSIFLKQYSHSRSQNIEQYVLTFAPILIVSYIHFTLHKYAYKNIYYILCCYANILVCLITSIWLNHKKYI